MTTDQKRNPIMSSPRVLTVFRCVRCGDYHCDSYCLRCRVLDVTIELDRQLRSALQAADEHPKDSPMAAMLRGKATAYQEANRRLDRYLLERDHE